MTEKSMSSQAFVSSSHLEVVDTLTQILLNGGTSKPLPSIADSFSKFLQPAATQAYWKLVDEGTKGTAAAAKVMAAVNVMSQVYGTK